MTSHHPRRLSIAGNSKLGAVAARVLDRSGAVVGIVIAPAETMDVAELREAIITRVLDEDFGDIVLAGVVFAPDLGGDAVGFT